MKPFVRLTSLAAPLPEANVDTDIIVPARFLLITEKKGLGRYAFYERRAGDGFVLDDARYAGAQILVVGGNFGCGSSREHAPWALLDFGIRCIIAPSFGEIFRANCARNGMLAVTLADPEWWRVLEAAERGETVTVDLATSSVYLADGSEIGFAIADAEREALLNGWDEIDGIRASYMDAIADFETRQRNTAPWLWQKEHSNG
jgi:3-isopropylmalate/(R)-2-methylmalate dehydratase small subunit